MTRNIAASVMLPLTEKGRQTSSPVTSINVDLPQRLVALVTIMKVEISSRSWM